MADKIFASQIVAKEISGDSIHKGALSGKLNSSPYLFLKLNSIK